MTLPGLSGSFILMLIGNYVLLLVDSVNALYDTFADIFQGDFTWTANVQRIELLQILVVFTIGSLVGLVSFSHLLGYVLKRFKKETYAIIIGFIAGSLGVVWPWKEAIYGVSPAVEISQGAGEQIVIGYTRYFPHRFDIETIFAIVFMIVGVLIVLSLDWYHLNKKNNE